MIMIKEIKIFTILYNVGKNVYTRRFMKLYSKSYLVLLFYFLIICVTSYIGATMKGFRGFDYGLVIGLVISVIYGSQLEGDMLSVLTLFINKKFVFCLLCFLYVFCLSVDMLNTILDYSPWITRPLYKL